MPQQEHADARVSSAPRTEQKSPVARATAEYFRDADRSARSRPDLEYVLPTTPHDAARIMPPIADVARYALLLEAGSAESQERERYLEQRCQGLEAALRECRASEYLSEVREIAERAMGMAK